MAIIVPKLNLNIGMPSLVLDAYSNGRDFAAWITDCISAPFVDKRFRSLALLESRISQEAQNPNKILKIFKKVADLSGWGSWISQMGLTVLDPKNNIARQLNYGLGGFPLSSALLFKMNFDRLKEAFKINDKEDTEYQIANVASSFFAFIGGILFVIAKFAVETSFAIGMSIALLPVYAISYFVDMIKNARKSKMSRQFTKKMNKIIKDDKDLNDPKKLEKAIQLLFKQIEITNAEKENIRSEVMLNSEVNSSSRLKSERINTKIDNLLFSKYKMLERRIGVEAAKDFRVNAKVALSDVRKFFSKTDSAKSLIQNVQNGAQKKLRDYILAILLGIVMLVGFSIATVMSAGILIPPLIIMA